MESCLNTVEIYYKDIDEYKININTIIEQMISENERLAFAVVSEKAGITPFIIRRYPELRTYMLQRMVYYKEIYVINQKINRVVNNIVKSNKSITFIEIVKRCKFSSDIIYQNQYIKDKIRSVLSANQLQK
jgi:hypothetical protein